MSRVPAVLTLPGWTNSGPDHWQSHWERRVPSITRIAQRDWDTPEPREWLDTLERAVAAARPAPVLLLGHSLGALAVAHWAQHPVPHAVAAVLVAPADPDQPGAPPALHPFGPVPRGPLTIPALLVASSDDPYLPLSRARELGAAWGAELVELVGAGHINTASGHGPWPEGWDLVQAFAAGLGRALPAWG